MKKSELLTQLNNQIDCVFTLAQVKTMIEGLEQETTFDVDKVCKDIQSCIYTKIASIDDSDIVDDSDIDFYIDGRKVCVETINVNYTPFRDAVCDGLDEWKIRLESKNG